MRVRPLPWIGTRSFHSHANISYFLAFIIKYLDQGIKVDRHHRPKERMGSRALEARQTGRSDPECEACEESWIVSLTTSIQDYLHLTRISHYISHRLKLHSCTRSAKGATLAESVGNSVVVTKIASKTVRQAFCIVREQMLGQYTLSYATYSHPVPRT